MVMDRCHTEDTFFTQLVRTDLKDDRHGFHDYHVHGKTGAIIKFESDKIIDVPDCIFTIKGEVMRIPKDRLTEPVSEK